MGIVSKDDPYPEVEFSTCRTSKPADSDQEDTCQIVTGFQNENSYCSPGTCLGKQKKVHFKSQPHFRSEVTLATIEAGQNLLAFQRLPSNSNSANFNNINRISKRPKSLTTTMPISGGKSEKFELFEDLFQTNIKIHNQLTKENKINYCHSLIRGDALQTFRNLSRPNRRRLGENRMVLKIEIRKRMKSLTGATAKHKF